MKSFHGYGRHERPRRHGGRHHHHDGSTAQATSNTDIFKSQRNEDDKSPSTCAKSMRR